MVEKRSRRKHVDGGRWVKSKEEERRELVLDARFAHGKLDVVIDDESLAAGCSYT